MRGLMQDEQLTITSLFERGVTLFPDSRIATLVADGTHEERFGTFAERVTKLAGALRELGVQRGDRVATFAWNSWRHAELYFAVPCLGAVLHTVNIRLHPEQLAWVLRDAGSRLAFVDHSLQESFMSATSKMRSQPLCISMGGPPEYGVCDYEALLATADPVTWPDLNERDASGLCYTSGTTGRPRGVLYSHRAMVLHAFMINQASVYGLTDRDVVLPLVPMFHANCWGLPYASVLAGANIALSGEFSADPQAVISLIAGQRVTIAGAVPSIWTNVLAFLEDHEADLSSLRAIVSGGATVPAALIAQFDDRFGIEVWQGWGMTETGPLGTFSRLPRSLDSLPRAEQHKMRAKQGWPVPGMRLRVLEPETGKSVPQDGSTVGELQARGSWVASRYFRRRSDESFDNGWLRTGDVAVIDEHGFIQIVDRIKDLVKSGGEWISSLELEAALLEHHAVHEAAVVATPDKKWGERPVAFVVCNRNGQPSAQDLREFLRERFPAWWLPDEIRFVAEIPKTSVGKLDKRRLRESLEAAVPPESSTADA